MPKQSIYANDNIGSVEISWGKDAEHVDIGTRLKDKPFTFDRMPQGEVSGPFESIHITLTTRSDVNDLIRTLRKARDQAFGADA